MLKTAVLTEPVILGTLFSVSLIFVSLSVFLSKSLVLGIFLLTFLIFFSRPYMAESCCALEINPN